MSEGRPNLEFLPRKDTLADVSWGVIREALRGLEFGSVTLIVQDGVLVQVERTEKRRFRRPAPSA